MSKHTPGPWKWGSNEYDNLEPGILGVAGAGYGNEHVVASEADKALIAAAPDLLAVCKQFVEMEGAAAKDEWHIMRIINALLPIYDAAEAAIAKAKVE